MYIYVIINKVNGKRYVGKAKNVRSRWQGHLQEAFDGETFAICGAIRKYGPNGFYLRIIEFGLTERQANELEKYHIKRLDSKVDNGQGYNLTDGGDGVCFPSEQTRLKMRNSHWKTYPDSHKQKISEGGKRSYKEGSRKKIEYTPDLLYRMGSANRGKKPSQEVVKRRADGLRLGFQLHPEWRKRVSEINSKRKLSEEHKKAFLAGVANWWATHPEEVAVIAAKTSERFKGKDPWNKGTPMSKEQKKKLSERAWTEEHKNRHLEGQRRRRERERAEKEKLHGLAIPTSA